MAARSGVATNRLLAAGISTCEGVVDGATRLPVGLGPRGAQDADLEGEIDVLGTV